MIHQERGGYGPRSLDPEVSACRLELDFSVPTYETKTSVGEGAMFGVRVAFSDPDFPRSRKLGV